jgi:Spy/CpxP family protein refolding chaperone
VNEPDQRGFPAEEDSRQLNGKFRTLGAKTGLETYKKKVDIMDKRFKIIVGVSIVAALAIMLATLPAFAQYRAGMQGMNGMQLGQGALFMRGLRFFQDLDLTQAQKDQIKAVLANHKKEIAAAIQDYVKARMALDDALWADSNYASAFSGVTQAEANGLALRAKLHKEIMLVLTADQIKQLDAKRDDIKMHVNQWLKRIGNL